MTAPSAEKRDTAMTLRSPLVALRASRTRLGPSLPPARQDQNVAVEPGHVVDERGTGPCQPFLEVRYGTRPYSPLIYGPDRNFVTVALPMGVHVRARI